MSRDTKKNGQPRLDPAVLQQKIYTARLRGHRPPPDLFDYETLERLEIEYVSIEALRPNTWNPNRMTEREFELLCLSIEEDGFCVEEHTPILCADLVWRPAGELKVGEELVAFDVDTAHGNIKHRRRFCSSMVTSNRIFEDDLYEVRVITGETVLCNAEHLWLATRPHGPMPGRFNGEWCKASDLLPGDEVYKIIDPWEVDKSYDAGWLAGFLDGEGCLSIEKTNNGSPVPTARLTVTQKPGLTAERMKKLMTERCPGAKVSLWEHVDQPKWQDNERVRLNQLGEIMSLLGSIRPTRLLEGGGRFWEGRSIVGKGGLKKEVVSINKVGRGNLSALSTSSKTYIASGFAMHNTQPVLVNHDNKIIDGEHRWRAAASLGMGEIPVVRVAMGDVQMRISTIRHNIARGSNVGSLEEIIYRELEQLGGIEWGKHSLLLEEVNFDSFEVPPLPDPPSHKERAPQEDSDDDEVVPDDDPDALPEFESFMTKQAQRLQHMREEMLPRAKTKEERNKIKREMVIFRLALAFSGEEAEIVREALAGNAAEEVLKVCRKKLGETNESAGRHGEEAGDGEESSR